MSEKRATRATPMQPVFVTIGENRWRVFAADGDALGTISNAGTELEAIALWNGDDVHRVSICFDACSGIPTRALEDNVIQEMVEIFQVFATMENIPENSPVTHLKRRAVEVISKIRPK